MTTIIGLTTTADFTKIKKYENPGSRPACLTNSEQAVFPGVPIGTGSPLFKLSVLISRCCVRWFRPASLVPDLVEEGDAGYLMSWPCCS